MHEGLMNRLVRRAGVVVLSAALGFGAAGVAWAANEAAPLLPESVASAKLPYVLSVMGAGGSSTIAVTLPDSATPIVFDGVVRSTFTYAGTIIVTINGRRIAQVPSRTGGRVHAVANAVYVERGVAVIGM